MVPMPRSEPEKDKDNALRYAKRKVTQWRTAEAEAHRAMWFAAEAGVSVRDIEDATGVPYRTVARIVSATREAEAGDAGGDDTDEGAAGPD